MLQVSKLKRSLLAFKLLAESFSCDEALIIEGILTPESLKLRRSERISLYTITLTLNIFSEELEENNKILK